ncbi:integral membrane protein involved in stabilizing FstZ ring during cell division [Nitrospira sp. KM1]|uniref:putative lipid II flippase FtsW n=1 Tax=Nitrospira sp. KM1 TaxID=1936990 RepID=UPI0013A7AA0B|nr:putative lipid II flippase FtsW [Nitrospira sp. KM1]BCA55829.1 integral membrane protein involved in stabilizing FstZ ring during cell division [Nitrospira sp. KM1]
MDHTILFITLTLALLGLVMVFSASAIVAGNRFHDPEFFLKRQVAWLGFGFALMHIASRIDYALWKKLSLPILLCMTALLVIVLIPGFGVVAKGARRWLHVGPISMQPAEMVKLVAVLYLAAYLTKKAEKLSLFRSGLLPPLIVIGLLGGLVLLEPDLGTVVVIGLVSVGLLFLGGARVSHLIALGLCAIPVVLMLILGSSYRRQRFLAFLAPWKDASDGGFQITQSFLAFGSGGPLGVGLGEGKQKLFFLPEAHTDFVLALIGEELGLAGTATVILLFAVFVWRGFVISSRARMPFGKFLGMGLTLLIGIQALVNAAVVTGLVPTKGLTLPFVSYGGSSLVISFICVGILLSISRDRHAGTSKVGRGDPDHG